MAKLPDHLMQSHILPGGIVRRLGFRTLRRLPATFEIHSSKLSKVDEVLFLVEATRNVSTHLHSHKFHRLPKNRTLYGRRVAVQAVATPGDAQEIVVYSE